MLAGCSGGQADQSAHDHELHEPDGEPGSLPGRHHFTCDDGRPALIDFKNKGLRIEVREVVTDAPLVLTAPAQGSPYVADRATATFSNNQFRLRLAHRTRTCERDED